jgi:hypothetical protein
VVLDLGMLQQPQSWARADVVVSFFGTLILLTLLTLLAAEYEIFGSIGHMNRAKNKKVTPSGADGRNGSLLSAFSGKSDKSRKTSPLDSSKASTSASLSKAQVNMERFINSLFPGSLGHKEGHQRLGRELMETELFTLILTGETQAERFSSALYLVSTVTVSSFLLATLYAIQYPVDDGTCETFIDSAACEEAKSMFDQDQPACYWLTAADPGDGAGELGHCEWRDVDISVDVLVAILLITVVVTGPVYAALNYAFDFIINAPTIEQVDDEKSALIHMKR